MPDVTAWKDDGIGTEPGFRIFFRCQAIRAIELCFLRLANKLPIFSDNGDASVIVVLSHDSTNP